MLRALLSLGTATAMVVTLTATPAGAGVPPPQGTFGCAIAGTITFKPWLTSGLSLKPVKMKLTATGTGCDAGGVTGGKAPITDVAVKVDQKLGTGAYCSAFPGEVGKIQVKLQGRNPQNKIMTVGVVNVPVFSLGANINSFDFVGVPVPAEKAFAGTHPIIVLNVTDPDPMTMCIAEGITVLNVDGFVNLVP